MPAIKHGIALYQGHPGRFGHPAGPVRATMRFRRSTRKQTSGFTHKCD